MTGLPLKPNLAFACVRLDERKVGNTVRYDLDLFRRNPVYGAQQLAAFFRHDDDPRRRIDDPVQDIAVCRCRLGKHRMQRRDDRHGQPRKQRHDVAAGFTAENAEFVLEGNGVEPARVQEVGRAHVIVYPFIPDLMADGGRVVVGVTVVGHRHDASFHVRVGRCNRLLQIGREGCDSAAARQRIPYECDTAELGHGRASVERTGEPAVAR